MSELAQLAQRVYAQLTAPGAPFEVVEQTIRGEPRRVYRNAFPNLPALIESARAHGDKPFIVHEGETWSFDRFFAEADALAAQLREWGLQPGDRVAVAMRNRPEWAVSVVAAALIGALPAPINSFGLREELSAAIADIEPAVLACDQERLVRLAGDPVLSTCRVVVAGEGPEQPGCLR
ncbi:MAG: AMP-binding protein, partial [Thauera sp.]|nr:AMP-binding protein [Thauera sp.]